MEKVWKRRKVTWTSAALAVPVALGIGIVIGWAGLMGWGWLHIVPWTSDMAPAWVQAVGSVAGIFAAIWVAVFTGVRQRREAALVKKAEEKAHYQSIMQLIIRVQDLCEEIEAWEKAKPKVTWKNARHYELSIDFLLAATERRMEGDRNFQRWFACLEIHEQLRNLRSMIGHTVGSAPALLEMASYVNGIATSHLDACREDLYALIGNEE